MGKIYFSASTKGFYLEGIHDNIPGDATEIDAAQHEALLQAQGRGARIASDKDGRPHAEAFVPQQADVMRALASAVQRHLNANAAKLGYNSIESAVSYAEEASVPKFQAEGIAFRAWRSLVWQAANEKLNSNPLPSAEELISGLPKLDL